MESSEINNLIAEKVMGWHLQKMKYAAAWFDENSNWTLKQTWNPSNDIRDAWQVVEKMRKDYDFWFELTTPESFSLKTKCYFQLDDIEVSAVCEIAPLAICKASLLAIEAKNKNLTK